MDQKAARKSDNRQLSEKGGIPLTLKFAETLTAEQFLLNQKGDSTGIAVELTTWETVDDGD